MSRFYFQWLGNKRLELKHLDNMVPWDKYDTIVEPFAGSAALTLELHARGLGKRHAVNDIDPMLIGMVRYIAANTSRPLYEYCRARLTPDEFKRHRALQEEGLSVEEYFYRMRVRGTYNRTHKVPDKWPSLIRGRRQELADECFAAATITNTDWQACVDAHKNDPKALIFLDPPYFNSFNQQYYGMDGIQVRPDGRILDGTHLFLEVLEYLKTASATVVVITNSCAIIDYIYAPYIRHRYVKTYAQSVKIGDNFVRKSTEHILLIGGGAPPPTPPVNLTDDEVAEVLGGLGL